MPDFSESFAAREVCEGMLTETTVSFFKFSDTHPICGTYKRGENLVSADFNQWLIKNRTLSNLRLFTETERLASRVCSIRNTSYRRNIVKFLGSRMCSVSAKLWKIPRGFDFDKFFTLILLLQLLLKGLFAMESFLSKIDVTPTVLWGNRGSISSSPVLQNLSIAYLPPSSWLAALAISIAALAPSPATINRQLVQSQVSRQYRDKQQLHHLVVDFLNVFQSRFSHHYRD